MSLVLRSALCAAAAACAALLPAAALDRGPVSLEILVDGRPLAEYPARGRVYVEAQRGREYALRLANHSGRRVAVALSVDGLDTIDARTTGAREAAKWILDPYQTVVLEGWQTSDSAARRFYFTGESGSYGAWLGKTRNLGVVAAVVYFERLPRPVPLVQAAPRAPGKGAPAPQEEAAPAAAPPSGAPAPGAAADAAAAGAARNEARSKSLAGAATRDELAATGIGREVAHPVESVAFDAEPRPAARLELRYEYHDALVKLGVLPRPDEDLDDALARREAARGFSGGFCPVPR